jgi:hypothetical protein
VCPTLTLSFRTGNRPASSVQIGRATQLNKQKKPVFAYSCLSFGVIEGGRSVARTYLIIPCGRDTEVQGSALQSPVP